MFIVKGNLGADPIINYVGTELEAVVNGTVFSWVGRNLRGEQHEDVPIRFSAWGSQAHYLAEHYEKGSRINFVGEERLEVYKSKENEGEERTSLSVRIIAILDEDSMKAMYADIWNWCRQSNEINFGIPARVNLAAEGENEALAESEDDAGTEPQS